MSSPLRQHRIGLARLGAELLDQGEHVAVVAVAAAAGGARRTSPAARLAALRFSHRARSSEVLVDLLVQVLPVGDDHERVQLPDTFRSTFWAKKIIENVLPEPWVCQNTPSRPWFALDPAQRVERVVHAEHLMVLGQDLDQPTRHAPGTA